MSWMVAARVGDYIHNIFVNSLNNRPCIDMNDRKKKREVRNHFGFALEDGKINRLVYSFLLTYIQNMHKRTARACDACMFSQRFQQLSISIYRDIFYRYIDTPNVESMTALVLAELSRPDIVEHKFDKNWELENGTKIGVLVFQKVAKTGNIGKKSPEAGDIDYVRYLSMGRLMTDLFVCNTNQPSLTYGLLFLRLPNNSKVALFSLFCLGFCNEKKRHFPVPTTFRLIDQFYKQN